MRLGALILTGGRSERMGTPKEFLPFGGETLLGRTARTLQGCADPIVIVRRDAAQELPTLPPGELTIVGDETPQAGPLAAIATGLRHLRDAEPDLEPDAVFVTGCDSPFLTAAAVRWLAEQLGDTDIAMPVHESIRQPLCAVYRPRVLATIDELLARGISGPRALTESVRTRLLETDELRTHDPELRFLRNVNTRAEYEQACRLLP